MKSVQELSVLSYELFSLNPDTIPLNNTTYEFKDCNSKYMTLLFFCLVSLLTQTGFKPIDLNHELKHLVEVLLNWNLQTLSSSFQNLLYDKQHYLFMLGLVAQLNQQFFEATKTNHILSLLYPQLRHQRQHFSQLSMVLYLLSKLIAETLRQALQCLLYQQKHFGSTKIKHFVKFGRNF